MANKGTGKKGFFGKILSALGSTPPDAPATSENEGQFAPKVKKPLDVRFVQKFTQNGGYFVYCGSKSELIDSITNIVKEHKLKNLGSPDPKIVKQFSTLQIKDSLADCQAICTYCEAMIAYNGGIMINEHQTKGIKLDSMPDYHIVIGKTSQLVENLHGAMSLVNQHYRNNRPGSISVLKGSQDETVRLASADPNKNRTLFLLLIEDSF